MKLLHYVEIENFKRYGEVQRLELDHPSVLIGPNNCGKTSALQAIALWSIGLKTWVAESENSKAEKRTGKALNRLNMLSVPVPKTRHLWNNLKTTKRDLRITVGVDFKGQAVPVTMEFTHHASAGLEISLLYPMSGITADEAVILPKRIEYLMGRGSTAEALRNICHLLADGAPGDWEQVTDLMRRLFHMRLGTPKVNDNGAVDLAYTQDGTVGDMDLGLSGRGFQQMLLIFSHLFLHKKGVLLIDEPEEDLSKGILESIDMDSYRVEKKQAIQIASADDDAEIDPMPVEGGGRKPEPELDRLSNILKAFNEQFGALFNDSDRIFTRIKDEIAPLVAENEAFRNARENTPGAARIEHDKALAKVMLTLLKDDTQVYKQFVENEAFRRAVSDFVYSLTAA